MDIILLADFSPIKPDPGIIIWASLVFLLVYFVLYRMAFKPISEALKERNDDIQKALDQARLAREEMTNLQAKNEELLRQAQEERSKILREAQQMKDGIIVEAKETARNEATRIVQNAKESIDNLRMAAVVDLKNQAGAMAIEIAEKVLKENLKGQSEQESFVKKLVEDASLN